MESDNFSGNMNWCNKCNGIRCIEYQRTKRGFVTRLYANQIKGSKGRTYGLPKYTKEELFIWLEEQKNYNKLRKNWEASNFDKMLTPSVDRINDHIGYNLDNIQLMTWEENQKKGNEDIKSGKTMKQNKPVAQYDLSGNLISIYHSGRHASRITNIFQTAISACCTGKVKTAGGFKWKFN